MKKTSGRQVAANGLNTKRSTGPRTLAGKAKVSVNAVKHGLTGRDVVLPGENAEDALKVLTEPSRTPQRKSLHSGLDLPLMFRYRLVHSPRTRRSRAANRSADQFCQILHSFVPLKLDVAEQPVVFSRLESSLYAKPLICLKICFDMIHWGVGPPDVTHPRRPWSKVTMSVLSEATRATMER